MLRSELRTLVWDYLGSSSTDPYYPAARVDRHLDTAFRNLMRKIHLQAPDYLRKKVTLEADAATSRIYTFTTQPVPILDFSRVLELRIEDEDGQLLSLVRDEELNLGGFVYSLVGPDQAVILETADTVDAGTDLYLSYEYKPTFATGDNAIPSAIPDDAHELLALEAAKILFGLGGEQAWPAELEDTLLDLRADLWAKLGRRSTEASQIRSA